ncbi:GroES-like protein [Coprinopsis marcescibilis]|uniref:GroES-like protein n=1 Tax=Coprinopsis marcescibilis TaxID=230819 RepID=A0A5C3KK04_COPMA|nr:GroES-like protein [Coprinopsis marcescibilis]
MEAVCYKAARKVELIAAPIPKIKEDQVLIKVTCCGICGTDYHLAEGEFLAKFPLIPGHEIVGYIAEVGNKVVDLKVGDRCVVDNTILCDSCFYCRRDQYLFCENFESLGVTTDGGFAEYVAAQSKKVYKINNLSDEEATLIEPTSCAIHGMDKLSPAVGVEALILGAGPTGLILAQLLRLNGASHITIAANKGIKTQIARDLNSADDYVELDRENPSQQWADIKAKHPRGFDVVIEATGSERVANDSINYVRRGGTLMIYGVYSNDARVHWSPAKIFSDEIKIIGSFAQTHCFPRAVNYLESGKINVKGLVTDVFTIKEYPQALERLNSKKACKIVVKP